MIEGGERIPVAVEWAVPAVPLPGGEDAQLTAALEDPANVLLVRTDSRGDFSTYTLRLVAGASSDEPPAGFDPLLAAVEFSFKVECPTDFDCLPACDCPPEVREAPAIDYLAKDFQSFRSLMLDRLSLLAPGWTERSTPDVGIALVELLAYVADELSYRQDAVATEAYLADRAAPDVAPPPRAARRLRRARGRERARVGARVRRAARASCSTRGTPLLTRVPNVPDVIEPDGEEHRDALAAGAETFETLDDHVLFLSHERFDFWTWGDAGCCLPRGATSATLVGDHPELKAGDVLVLAEVAGPLTGNAADADPGEARRGPAHARRTRRAIRPADSSTTRRLLRTWTSPRSSGTRPTRCRSRSASRSRSGPSWSSPRRGGTSCSPTTAARSPTSRSARCRTPSSRASRTTATRATAKKPEPVPIRFRPTLSRSAGDPGARGAAARGRRRAGRRRRSRPRSRRSRSTRSCTTGSTTAASASRPATPSSAAATTSGR